MQIHTMDTGIEGLGYRYLVKVYHNENMRTYRGSITSISPSEVHTMKYVFGSNHLFIAKEKRLYKMYRPQKLDLKSNDWSRYFYG